MVLLVAMKRKYDEITELPEDRRLHGGKQVEKESPATAFY
jgi:hypothetical protein